MSFLTAGILAAGLSIPFIRDNMSDTLNKAELKQMEQIFQTQKDQGVFLDGKIRVLDTRHPEILINGILELARKSGKEYELFVRQGISREKTPYTAEVVAKYLAIRNGKTVVYRSDGENKGDFKVTVSDVDFVLRQNDRSSAQIMFITVKPDGTFE